MEMIGICCDECKTMYETPHGYTCMIEENTIREYADSDGWISYKGNDFCPKCATLDDDVGIVINTQKTN